MICKAYWIFLNLKQLPWYIPIEVSGGGDGRGFGCQNHAYYSHHKASEMYKV